MLGITRTELEWLFGNNKNTITSLFNQHKGLTSKTEQYIKERIKVQTNRKYQGDSLYLDDDFYNSIRMEGQGGIIWVEQLENIHVAESARGRWALFDITHAQGENYLNKKKQPINSMSNKYYPFAIALSTLGEKLKNIEKILAATGYNINWEVLKADLENLSDTETPEVPRVSYILRSTGYRRDLQEYIGNLIEKGTQGFIFIERFNLPYNGKDRPNRSKWLVIHNVI